MLHNQNQYMTTIDVCTNIRNSSIALMISIWNCSLGLAFSCCFMADCTSICTMTNKTSCPISKYNTVRVLSRMDIWFDAILTITIYVRKNEITHIRRCHFRRIDLLMWSRNETTLIPIITQQMSINASNSANQIQSNRVYLRLDVFLRLILTNLFAKPSYSWSGYVFAR